MVEFARSVKIEHKRQKLESQIQKLEDVKIISKTSSVDEYPPNQVGIYGEHEGSANENEEELEKSQCESR